MNQLRIADCGLRNLRVGLAAIDLSLRMRNPQSAIYNSRSQGVP